MFDCSDRERNEEISQHFRGSVLNQIGEDFDKAKSTTPILIFANKKDLPDAMSIDEILLIFE